MRIIFFSILFLSFNIQAIDLSQSDKQNMVDIMSDTLCKKYISHKKAQKLIQMLNTFSQQNTPNNSKLWAEELNDRLYQISKDHHLLLWYTEPNKKQGVIFKKENNYGFHSFKTLPGDIAYIRLDEFSTHKQAFDLVDASMIMAQSSNALISDLRYNRGGSGALVCQFLGYFFEKRTSINTYRFRYKKTVHTYKTNKIAKKRQWLGKKLYVLTGPQTASAAEIFVNAVKTFNKGTIIGNTTAGLGNVADIQVLTHGLSLLFTHGYDEPPKPGKNWDGIGIEPNIHCADENALALAHKLTLEGQNYQQNQKKWYENTLAWLYQKHSAKSVKKVTGEFGRYKLFENNSQYYYQKYPYKAMKIEALNDSVLMFVDMSIKSQIILNREDDSISLLNQHGESKTYKRTK